MAACYAMTGHPGKATRLLQEFIDHARDDMPIFPGTRFSDWMDYWRQSADNKNDNNHALFVEAIRSAWPDLN
jgi:hypothetical protein